MKSIIAALITVVGCSAIAQIKPAAELSLTTISINDEGEHLLADSKGNTLYIFDMDQNQKSSVCNAKCAEVWPPYLLNAEEVKTLKAPLGSIVRANQTLQLTYNGSPVYAYAYDRGAAADAGDGVGGVWHYLEIK